MKSIRRWNCAVLVGVGWVIEIYRGYQQSRDETSLLFYRDTSLNPVSQIGREKGYDYIHIVRPVEHGSVVPFNS
jgi:hypothetical protein